MRRRDFLKGLAAVVGCGVAGKAAATEHQFHAGEPRTFLIPRPSGKTKTRIVRPHGPTDWPAGNAEPGFDFWAPIAQARLPLA